MMHGRPELLTKGKDLPPKKQSLTGPEAAEHVAIQALTFIGSDPERLGRFLSTTGIGPQELRRAAAEPQFLRGVIEYLAGDEPTLLEFCKGSDIDPVTVMFALEALGGRNPQREGT
jgi:hypothetical protein